MLEPEFEAKVIERPMKYAFIILHDSDLGLSKHNYADPSSLKELPIMFILSLFRKNLFYLFPLPWVAGKGLQATLSFQQMTDW